MTIHLFLTRVKPEDLPIRCRYCGEAFSQVRFHAGRYDVSHTCTPAPGQMTKALEEWASAERAEADRLFSQNQETL